MKEYNLLSRSSQFNSCLEDFPLHRSHILTMSASDSDDDKPLMELIRKRKAQVSAEAISSAQKKKEKDDVPPAKKVKTEPAATAKKPVVKEEKSSSAKASSSSSKPTSSRTSSSSSAQYSIDFYETDKGQMVQRLLCRWWYAITWPKPEDIGAPPAGYEALDGFPGVFICTSVSIFMRRKL